MFDSSLHNKERFLKNWSSKMGLNRSIKNKIYRIVEIVANASMNWNNCEREASYTCSGWLRIWSMRSAGRSWSVQMQCTAVNKGNLSVRFRAFSMSWTSSAVAGPCSFCPDSNSSSSCLIVCHIFNMMLPIAQICIKKKINQEKKY